jgi:hypothetical protein
MTTLDTSLTRDATFARRAAHWRAKLDAIQGHEAQLRLGGGD